MKQPTQLDLLLASLRPDERPRFLLLWARLNNPNENDELLVIISSLLFARELFEALPQRVEVEHGALKKTFGQFSTEAERRMKETERLERSLTACTKDLCAAVKTLEADLNGHSADYARTAAFLGSGEYANFIADKLVSRITPVLESSVERAAMELRDAHRELLAEHRNFIPTCFDEGVKREAFLRNLDVMLARAALPKAPMIVPWLICMLLAGVLGYTLR